MIFTRCPCTLLCFFGVDSCSLPKRRFRIYGMQDHSQQQQPRPVSHLQHTRFGVRVCLVFFFVFVLGSVFDGVFGSPI